MISGPHDKEFTYYCLSTETKPNSPDYDVIGNSVLYEIDADTLTTTKYRFSGNQWVKQSVEESKPLAMKVYEDGADLYLCKAEVASSLSSAVWQVRKITTSSGFVITWADGDANYDNLATDLATVKALVYE